MSETSDEQARFTRVDRILEETVAGTVMLFDPETGRYLKLNPSGKVLWAAIGARKDASLGQLASELEAGFGIGPQTAAEDAGRFVEALADGGFIRPV